MGVTTAPVLSGWTPVRVDWRDGTAVVDWCRTDGVPFTEPFFDQTVETCFRHPFRLLFRQQTSIDDLGTFAATHPGLEPAGFVFHMSRCGSTLVSQMLASTSAHLVLSEAPPIDSLLRAPGAGPRAEWLRWMMAALGQPRGPARRLFVKFDAWSALQLPLVRRAFPEVPWIFLFRDPVEVLVSHMRRRGAHVIPGALPAETFGMTAADVARLSPLDYAAAVLARICEAALEWTDDSHATFVDYSRLPGFVVGELLDAWSVRLSGGDCQRMREAAERDAKNSAVPFLRDAARKRAQATDEITAAADRWLGPVYERLWHAQ